MKALSKWKTAPATCGSLLKGLGYPVRGHALPSRAASNLASAFSVSPSEPCFVKRVGVMAARWAKQLLSPPIRETFFERLCWSQDVSFGVPLALKQSEEALFFVSMCEAHVTPRNRILLTDSSTLQNLRPTRVALNAFAATQSLGNSLAHSLTKGPS